MTAFGWGVFVGVFGVLVVLTAALLVSDWRTFK